MVVDSSALIAIVFEEADAAEFDAVLAAEETILLSAANWFEACIRADNADDPNAGRTLDQIVALFDIAIMPVTADQAAIARGAYRTCGRANHPAALNFGDCFAYALAKSTSRPLLFKGEDFSKTDIIPARAMR
ncbi:MAG: type II toxin-antitoxin system VapC family toxin [Pseudomonadota bacterium]